MIRALGEKVVMTDAKSVFAAQSGLLELGHGDALPVLMRGKVTSVGPRVDRAKFPICPGDIVSFRPYIGNEPAFVDMGSDVVFPSANLYTFGESDLAIGARVIVKEVDTKTAKYGSIEVCRFEPAIMVSGLVQSIGPGVNLSAIPIEVGQRVWYRRECGYELNGGLVALDQDQLSCECPKELEAMKHWYQQ